MLSKEILWIVIVSTAVLSMFSIAMLLDLYDEIRQQRQARKMFWDWIWYTNQRRRRLG